MRKPLDWYVAHCRHYASFCYSGFLMIWPSWVPFQMGLSLLSFTHKLYLPTFPFCPNQTLSSKSSSHTTSHSAFSDLLAGSTARYYSFYLSHKSLMILNTSYAVFHYLYTYVYIIPIRSMHLEDRVSILFSSTWQKADVSKIFLNESEKKKKDKHCGILVILKSSILFPFPVELLCLSHLCFSLVIGWDKT